MFFDLDSNVYAPLQSGILTIQRFTNTSDKSMLITEILLKFDWMGSYHYFRKCNIKVEAGKTVELPEIRFTIDLGVPIGSHNYKSGVSYKLLENENWVSHEHTYVSRGDFIEIKRLPPKDFKVFVSHSNKPSDANFIRACKEAMRACGLTGYFAEDDIKPGIKLWDKIAREIILSDAFLVLWTKSAGESGDVREEIGMAVGAKKQDRIVPVVEVGIDVYGFLKSSGIEWVNYEPPNHTNALSVALETIMAWAVEKEAKKVRRERTQKKKTNENSGSDLN